MATADRALNPVARSEAGRVDRHLEDLLIAYEDAAARHGELRESLICADRALTLRFAGPAMSSALLPALAHLRDDPPHPRRDDVEIAVWDSATTGVNAPPPPWGAADVGVHGLVQGGHAERFRALWDARHRTLSLFDTLTRRGVFWARDAAQLPWHERAAPMRVLLNWALTGGGRQLLHAGAVGDGDRAVLLGGASGAGKSTLALACLQDGLGLMGEDRVILDFAGSTPVAHSVYSSAKLNADSAAMLPGLAAAFERHGGGDDEKVVLQLHGARLGPLLARARVAAVVLPTVSEPAGELRRVAGGRALLAIGPSTVLPMPDAAEALQATGRLLRVVPTYALSVGPDIAAGPRAVRRLLAGVDR
jgi:hypothetical protein